MPIDEQCDHRHRFFARDEDYVPCPECRAMTIIPALDAAVKRLMLLDQESVFALVDIAEERVRQISGENWLPEHDDRHASGEMSKAAAAYALAPHTHKYSVSIRPSFWPWGQEWWKPKSIHRNRVRAGALLVAELARHLRSASSVRAIPNNGGDISAAMPRE